MVLYDSFLGTLYILLVIDCVWMEAKVCVYGSMAVKLQGVIKYPLQFT